MEPLHNYLKKEVNSHIVVRDIIASTPAENLLTRKKIKFLTLDSFFTKSETLLSMLKNFIKYKFILKKINEKLLKNIITEDEFQKFKSDASSIYFLGFFMDQLDKMIKKLEIDIIITANNVESTMGAVTHSAKKHKIQHICIHNTAFERIDLPNYADCHIYCSDSYDYKTFLENKTKKSNIVSLGLPAYDKIYMENKIDKNYKKKI